MSDAQYGYDATSQLTSAVYDKLPAEVYDYDANGNRKNFETGANNQLTSDGVFRHTYDDEGNRIEKRSKDSLTRYEWDHRNRLVRANRMTENETVRGTLKIAHERSGVSPFEICGQRGGH